MAEFYVASARIELAVWDSNSLKDKRAVLRSILDRARARFNISIAEVGAQDSWRRSVIAIAVVNSQAERAERTLRHIATFIESTFPCEVLSLEIEVY